MNFKLITIIIVILTLNVLHAQTIKFERLYGGTGYDYGYSVQQTFDEGYIVAGATTSFGVGSTDAYILKTDSMGIPEWHKTYGGINIDQAYSIKQTVDSGYVIAGYTNSFGNGGYDMYVIKTNKYGDAIWTKTYGGANWDFAYSIDITADGGYIITGGTYSYGKGNEDMYLVKINSIGDTLWTKTFGGTDEDEAKSVKQTSDGGYVITGFTKSMGEVNGDVYTVKTDTIGDTLWTYKFGGLQEDIAYDIIEGYTGEYFVGGKTKSIGAGNFDGLIIKLSPMGLFLTNSTYGGVNDDGIHSITESPTGRFSMIGYTYSYGFALGTSDYVCYIERPYGNFITSTTYGGNKNEKAYCINNTTDGGYIICGNADSYSNLDHIFLIKTDSNGIAPITPIVTITNINSNSKSNNIFKIFPTPTNSNFFIQILDKTIIQNNSLIITITDILGRKYYQQITNKNNTSETLEIITDNLFSGIYFITIETDNTKYVEKIVVQH